MRSKLIPHLGCRVPESVTAGLGLLRLSVAPEHTHGVKAGADLEFGSRLTLHPATFHSFCTLLQMRRPQPMPLCARGSFQKTVRSQQLLNNHLAGLGRGRAFIAKVTRPGGRGRAIARLPLASRESQRLCRG